MPIGRENQKLDMILTEPRINSFNYNFQGELNVVFIMLTLSWLVFPLLICMKMIIQEN